MIYALILVVLALLPVSPVRAETSKSLWKNMANSVKERLIKTKSTIIHHNSDSVEKESELDNKNKKNEEKENKKDYPDENVKLEDMEKHVEFASSVTGVSKDFLMGMLVVESALGQNIGQCTYAEVERDAEKSYKNGRLSERAWKTFQERKKLLKIWPRA